MNFQEMISALKNGKLARRESWTETDGFLVLMPSMKYVWKILVAPTPNAGNHGFCVEEFLAEDWMVFEAACGDLVNVLPKQLEGEFVDAA
jgi:hypothetical protein